MKLPFLHFFWMVLVGTQESSPFFKVNVLDLVLDLASHSVHGPLAYRHESIIIAILVRLSSSPVLKSVLVYAS